MKTKVAVFFGGRSVEHEVSIISGIQALLSIDTSQYDPIPVYIAKDGAFYIGDDLATIEAYQDLNALVEGATRVILVNEDDRVYLAPYPQRLFHKEKIAIDVALPVVHGTNVEDGTLQGVFTSVGLPYAGCDVCTSAVGMDKYVQKAVLRENGIPVLDSRILTSADYADMQGCVQRIEDAFPYPVIVKPANLGSSVGIGVANDRDELIRRIDDAFLYSMRVLVEPAITNLREINCSVLGDSDETEASVCEEPMHSKDILSYEDKYLGSGGKSGSKGGAKGGGKSQGMASTSRQIPANISAEQTARIQELSTRAFGALGCNGVVRIDYLLDGDTGEVWFNEINTIPGSLAFYLWEASGVSYSQLLDRLIKLALKRARRNASLTFAFDTNILSTASLSGTKAAKR